jgi:hypothetical protein
MSFRFFDPATRKRAIYWASTRRPGVIQTPVFGAFSGDTSTFEGSDTFEGCPIRVRFTWSGITTPAPRREQAFSDDGGRMRETSWVMEMVFSQLTKGPMRTSGGGWQHVADLDLVFGDDHPVDEQLHQLASLRERGRGQSGSDGLAERFDAVGHGLQLQALFSGGV